MFTFYDGSSRPMLCEGSSKLPNESDDFSLGKGVINPAVIIGYEFYSDLNRPMRSLRFWTLGKSIAGILGFSLIGSGEAVFTISCTGKSMSSKL